MQASGVDEFGRKGGGHFIREAVDEVVDYGAETSVQLDFGVEHVFHDAGEEAMADEAHEVAWVEEAAAFTEFPECACYSREVEGDFWGNVFDVEGDDLLFED